MSEEELGRLGLFMNLIGTIAVAFSVKEYFDSPILNFNASLIHNFAYIDPLLLKIGLGLIALGFILQVFALDGPSIRYKKERILRVLIKYCAGGFGAGSGFFINKNGELLTCFHVVFGSELKNLRLSPNFTSISGIDEHTRLEQYLRNTISSMEIELPDGTIKEAELKDFSEKYDVAILKLKEPLKNINYFKIDFTNTLDYGDEVLFCGFQLSHGYNNDKFPFAVNTGIISSFPEATVGGDSYKHIQINSINLGGNSGAPLFGKGRKNVIGVINGNMNMGNENIVIHNPQNNQNTIGSIRIPLSVAYATPMKLLKEETKLF